MAWPTAPANSTTLTNAILLPLYDALPNAAGDHNGKGYSKTNNDAISLKRLLDSRFNSPLLVFPAGYNFTTLAQGVTATAGEIAVSSPGGTMTGGVSVTITIAAVPRGVNHSDAGHKLHIAGGTGGAAEDVTITGGTAVAGNSSGTLTFIPANSHAGAWTISSATAGSYEAAKDAGMTGGVGQSNLNIFVTSPSWTQVWPNVNEPLHVNVNNYPIAAQHQDCLINAIAGKFAAPVGSTLPAANGVAGFGVTASPTTAAVGVYGQSSVSLANAQGAWGGNFLATNALNQLSSAGSGFVTPTLRGIEVDINCHNNGSGGTAADVVGVDVVGGSSDQGTASSAIRISPMGIFSTPNVKWKTGLEIYPGSCDEAIKIGTLNTATAGVGSGSGLIRFLSIDDSDVLRYCQMNTDKFGDFTLLAAQNAIIFLCNFAGSKGLKIFDATGYVQVTDRLGIGTPNPGSPLGVIGLPVYADNTAAGSGGLAAGDVYRTSAGTLMVRF